MENRKPSGPKKTETNEEVAVQAKRPDPSNRANRPRKSSAGGAAGRSVLSVSGELDPNFIYRTVNDEGSRIEQLKSYGYDIEQGKDLSYNSSNEIKTGSAHSVVVDKRTGKRGVLMRQPREFHEEDKRLKAKAIDKTEESMFRALKTDDGRYGDIENTSSLAKASDD